MDTTEGERRRALDIVAALREAETRDELGLGMIRDGLSELLFPGTSTIQTHARYFLFVPWIYRDLERRRTPASEIAAKARRAELALVAPLVESSGPRGVIGSQARDRLQRLPSGIYWAGLAAWGIRRFPGHQFQYHRSVDAFYRRVGRRSEDDQLLGDAAAVNWDEALPEPPEGLPESATLVLRANERDYLAHRIAVSAPGTFLDHLSRVEPWEPVGFPWEHPAAETAGDATTRVLHHARCFSEALQGARLLYNLMLAERYSAEDHRPTYRALMTEWATLVEERSDRIDEWSARELPELWELLREWRITPPSRRFITDFTHRIRSAGPHAIADDAEARGLVHAREVRLKRRLARLENASALNRWSGASGAGRLDMRWGTSQQILLEVVAGA
jgi:hypothetical protein